LSCAFSRLVDRAGEQHRHIAQLGKNLLEVEGVLRGQDFGGGQDRHLVAVFDGDHRGFGGHDGLAAAHVALQQAVHGVRLLHVVRDLLDDALLRPGGLEGQHGLDAFAHAGADFEGDAGQRAGLAALQRHAALQPEELFENEAELRGRAESVEQAEVGIGRRKVNLPEGGPEVGHFEALAQILRELVFDAARATPARGA
jgi:hypothetical protein